MDAQEVARRTPDDIEAMQDPDIVAKQLREEGKSPRDAAYTAAELRFRPILMTASTTVLGMLPLAIGAGAGGEIQAALARAVIGGLTVSTLITQVVIPAAYTGIHDFRVNKPR